MTDPVLICGGGIGGLSAAIAFAHAGLPVRVLEQSESFSEAGAGIELGPNAARHLGAWGLEEFMSTFSIEPEGMHVYDGLSDALLTTVPLGRFVRERYGAPYLVIHRKHLQHCLLEAAAALDGIEIETGFKLTQLDARPSGVTATSDAGAIVQGRALVGADGLWSTVRASISDDAPHTTGVTAWRALLPAAKAPKAVIEPYIGLWLGPYGHVIHYPLEAGTTIAVIAMIEETTNFDGWASPGKSADLLPYFDTWGDQVLELLGLPDDWHKWTIMTMDPLNQWSKGPVTLIGDAAHPIEPFMAQGGATAIEDAALLAAAAAAHPEDMVTAFNAYEANRRARATRIQKASHQRGRIYHMSGAMRWGRDQLLCRQDPETFVTRYDWLYSPQAEPLAH